MDFKTLMFVGRFSQLTKDTRSPFSMMALRRLPRSEPDLTSSLRRSPDDKWQKPKSRTMLAHWVPLPLPGPPEQETVEKRIVKVKKKGTRKREGGGGVY